MLLLLQEDEALLVSFIYFSLDDHLTRKKLLGCFSPQNNNKKNLIGPLARQTSLNANLQVEPLVKMVTRLDAAEIKGIWFA